MIKYIPRDDYGPKSLPGDKVTIQMKKWYANTARELGYSAEVQKALSEAHTESELIRIMATARHEMSKHEYSE
jgi:hypothetical protein